MWATTDAVLPAEALVTVVTPLIVGVTGAATTLTVAVPVLFPPERETTHDSVAVPTDPTENWTELVPAPAEMEPFVSDHAYVAPDCGTTEATSPPLPSVALAGAVMVAAGAALTVAQAVSVIEGSTESVAVRL